ncbi:DegT/DnrJ/EryC1/StrS family aminotransferase [Desulfosporosinus youngiae]|uniref:Putative PLP-dependent enzyme possibly involved in cell wall biogenesis n=1 Tax=Desulfosporosinus youngiae DSM 17734 TaxID=768710 RepID=H5XZG1_9FIRM|nr:DegT/DnrJ/EryC1/StrS family aminotransferase [Desulfosporosinus youngiae]EHQ91867.1 putative PLP-dependent enzyme possibly involved in cell wall biogenesis [Desulfosporosinus youngiae DSM 17734]
MNAHRINVTKSSMPEFEEYIQALKPVWDSRWLSNRGAASVELENKLKEYLGTEHLYLFANGHVALEVALNALYLEGEVITTPYTHCSTTHAIVRNGLTPVFVDVEEYTYTINPELIEQAITEKTVAIVATHVYGFVCDVEKIERIARKHNIKVIYDAAHAFGVTYKGVGIANFGDAAMFSTHATKAFHTIEGGIVAYKDSVLFKAMSYLVNFGFTSHEDIDYIGTNARMNEFEAVMGICNLRHFDEETAKRKAAGDRYMERLDGVKGIKLIKPDANLKWNYAYFPVVFDGYKETRDEIKAKLEADNIFARKYFYPIVNKAACYADTYGDANVLVASHAAECVLTLPMYADLAVEDVDRICDIILR